jgi:type IV pilus assembly protein PilF
MIPEVTMQSLSFIFLATTLLFSCASKVDKAVMKKADIHFTYGTEELFNKNYTQAITHLLKAAELDPENDKVHNNLAMAYYFKEEKEMAIKHTKRALEINPKNTDALVNLASLHFEEGDLQKAEKIYLEALKDLTFEKHARTYYNLGLIEVQRKNLNKGRAYLDKSLKQSEDFCPSWLQLGLLDLKARKPKDAAKKFHQARMGSCANDPAPLYWHAVAIMETKEYLNARMKFDELETRFPDSDYSRLAHQKLTEITLLENESTPKNYSKSTLEDHNF